MFLKVIFLLLVVFFDVRGFLDRGYKFFRNNDGDFSFFVSLSYRITKLF